jgi:hypothetical protein
LFTLQTKQNEDFGLFGVPQLSYYLVQLKIAQLPLILDIIQLVHTLDPIRIEMLLVHFQVEAIGKSLQDHVWRLDHNEFDAYPRVKQAKDMSDLAYYLGFEFFAS